PSQQTVLDVFLLCLTIWLIGHTLETPGRLSGWFKIGLALGCLSLTRENALLLVGVAFIWIATHFRGAGSARLKFAGAVSLGLGIVLLPVTMRNQIVGGEFHLTTSQFGPNFFIGNNE